MVNWTVQWTKYCVLSASGRDNEIDDANSINFTIKEAKLYVPVVTLLAKDNQKRSKIFSKEFERSI